MSRENLLTKNEREYLKVFGSVIKDLRVDVAQKSLRLFAYENDIPCATLSRIENGIRIPNLLTLKKIASGFNLDVGEFISRVESRIPSELKTIEI